MRIGLIKEIKKHEYRVGLTPWSASEYVHAGHEVLVESGAGLGSGFSDEDYARGGSKIVGDKKDLFNRAEMIVKVKEPLPEEYDFFHEGQILYTYLHLAADKRQAEALLRKKVKAVAYETVLEKDGSLPLLVPMSQIAGRLAIQEGAKYLEKFYGGSGVLLGGVPGIRKGKVLILGGGISGFNACQMALGMNAEVTIIDISSKRLAELDSIFGGRVQTLYSNYYNIEEEIKRADLVVGAVLIPGATTPKLIQRKHLKMMKPGSVIVDVAVDQGGCCETTKATYHDDPIYTVDGVIHYCVANMPGAVSLSATYALTSVTNRYGLQIANQGLEKALGESAPLRAGLNCYLGKLTHPQVAKSLGIPYEAYQN